MPDTSSQSTKKQLVSGVFYTGVARYAGVVVGLVIAGILARLLSPDDFGIMATATILITFFAIFSDMGIAPAIIQNKELSNDEISEIFSFTVWVGIVISVLFYCCSGFIANYYNSPQLLYVCRLLSINLFFATVNIVPNALVFKAKRFKFLAVRTIGVQTAVGTIAVIAAYSGAGIYALLINPILTSIILFVMSFCLYPQKLTLSLGLAPIRKIFAYSMYQFLFNILNFFSRNLDKLLIGRYLSLTQLGYYEKSYRLMMLPLSNITFIITPVMHPVFSELQHNIKSMAESYLKVMRLLAFIGLPLSALLYFAAPELILLAFGSQWGESVPVFRILSLSVGIQIIYSSMASVYQAANSTKIMFVSGVISTITNIIAMAIGVFVFRTMEAVAYGVCVSYLLNFIQNYILMYKYTFKLSMRPFFKMLVSPLILTSISVIAIYLVTQLLPEMNLILSLVIKSAVAGVIWVTYIHLGGYYNLLNRNFFK